MPVAPTMTLTQSRLQPSRYPDRVSTRAIRLGSNVSFSAGQVLEEVTTDAANAVHTLTYGGTVSGGTFTLRYANGLGNITTAAIAYSGTAATQRANIQAALDAALGAGNTLVAGSGPYTVTYQGELANRPISLPTATNNLTGTSPTITPTSTTTGATGSSYQAYSSGAGLCVLGTNVTTDLAGNILDQFGKAGQTAFAFDGGYFYASQLLGVDTTAVPTDGTFGKLGKLLYGASLSAAGAEVHLGG